MFLFLLFFYSFSLLLALPLFFSTAKLLYFSPFLVFTFYRCRKIDSLWLALVCGLIVDLLSIQMRFGVHALSYTLTVFLLFDLKNYLFEERWTTLPLMTLLFTFLLNFIQLLVLFYFSSAYSYPLKWMILDLFLASMHNLFYTTMAFSILFYFFPSKLKKTPSVVRFNKGLA